MNLSLYAMTTQMIELLEADEVSEEMMQQVFGDITAKDAKICHFVRDIEGAIDAHKAEEKRIADRRKAMENKVKQLKEYMQLCMERLEIDSIQAGTFKVSIAKNPPALDVIDATMTPAEYKVIIPETWEADKARIKDALKAGQEVPGYALKVGRSLRIR